MVPSINVLVIKGIFKKSFPLVILLLGFNLKRYVRYGAILYYS